MAINFLLVDNNSDYRRSLRAILELEDYRVEEASSVEEAKDKLNRLQVDLVLLDLRLTRDEDSADVSGFEIAKLAADINKPTIFLTAFPTVEGARMALRSRGAEPYAIDFVAKSQGPQVILDTVKAVLAKLQRNTRDNTT